MKNKYTNKPQSIEEIAYTKYRYYWLAERGYDINDVVSRILQYAAEQDVEINDVEELISEWEAEDGMGGSLYVCFDEFRDEEFQDVPFMRQLLNDDEFHAYGVRLFVDYLKTVPFDKKALVFTEEINYYPYQFKAGKSYKELLDFFSYLFSMTKEDVEEMLQEVKA